MTAPAFREPVPLSIRGLVVYYRDRPSIWNVDYDVPEGALCAIVGPNGAGKTTLIKAALDLIPRVAGEVRIYGQPLRRSRSLVAYMPQRSEVDWEYPVSALDVVAMGLYGKVGLCRPLRRRHRDLALSHLDRVGMADFGDRQIGQLSGGQQQRVFLARALAQEARLYLLDEPLAGVDAATESVILQVWQDLQKSGASVVCIHHDLHTVSEYFDHVLVLNVRSIAAGRVEETMTEGVLSTAFGGRVAVTGSSRPGAEG